MTAAKLQVRTVGYSFPAGLFHPRQHAGLSRRSGPSYPKAVATGKPHESNRHLGNGRALVTKASHLLKRMGHLQDAEVRVVAADNLHTDWKPLGREASGY